MTALWDDLLNPNLPIHGHTQRDAGVGPIQIRGVDEEPALWYTNYEYLDARVPLPPGPKGGRRPKIRRWRCEMRQASGQARSLFLARPRRTGHTSTGHIGIGQAKLVYGLCLVWVMKQFNTEAANTM